MVITVRRATESDFPLVKQVFSEANRFHAALLPQRFRVADPIITPDWLAAVLVDGDKALFVAEADHQVVGVLLLRLMRSPEDPIFRPRRYANVDEVAVLESHQGRGIGHRLMQRAAEWAKRQSAQGIELSVAEANRRAIALYEGMGYETTRRRMAIRIDGTGSEDGVTPPARP
jgi:ribosomal protein S18 acetylase RimI-like enzyme